jgi:AAA domain
MSTAPEHANAEGINGSGAKSGGWAAHVFTAAELKAMTLPEVSYVVPGLIPEGLSIFAGRPKIGKSWLGLDLALGISSDDGHVLGGIEVTHGDVLYCALEDNPRRLQRRITKLLWPSSVEWPKRLTLATRWRRLDQGGVEDIEAWCKSVAEPRLVLLDTLAGVRPARSGLDSLYEGDYKALAEIHHLANERRMAAVALHHTRKMDADDPLDTISGSLGLAGAADTCLVLARTHSGTTLYVRGRDVEESEKAVLFNAERCKWSILGEAAEVHRSDSRKTILSVLQRASRPMGPADIAAGTEINRNNIDQLLRRMSLDGEVIQVSRGRYAHPDKAAEFLTTHKNRKK